MYAEGDNTGLFSYIISKATWLSKKDIFASVFCITFVSNSFSGLRDGSGRAARGNARRSSRKLPVLLAKFRGYWFSGSQTVSISFLCPPIFPATMFFLTFVSFMFPRLLYYLLFLPLPPPNSGLSLQRNCRSASSPCVTSSGIWMTQLNANTFSRIKIRAIRLARFTYKGEPG